MRSADETYTATLPVTGSNKGGVVYLVRSKPAATEMVEAFAAQRPLPET